MINRKNEIMGVASNMTKRMRDILPEIDKISRTGVYTHPSKSEGLYGGDYRDICHHHFNEYEEEDN
jgi:hypothetical protein